MNTDEPAFAKVAAGRHRQTLIEYEGRDSPQRPASSRRGKRKQRREREKSKAKIVTGK
jgi:hypothetical protein